MSKRRGWRSMNEWETAFGSIDGRVLAVWT
jgi:hypothetical protein